MKTTDARRRMIHAAIDLFHRQGVNATSVDQVLEASGTGKGQFTLYFRTKTGLVRAAVEWLSGEIRAGRVPTGYRIESWKQLEGWFDAFLAYQKSVKFSRSCPMGTIGNDIIDDKCPLRDELVDFIEWSRGQLAGFFREKQRAGELAASARPRAVADLFVSVMQGGMLLTKIRRDPAVFRAAAGQALAYVESLRIRAK